MNPEIIKEIIKILEDKKLKNIEAFDLKNKSRLVKFIILATSTNEKTCRLLAHEVQEELNKINMSTTMEGEFPGNWIILDAAEILIEIFTEDARKYYNLEKLWGDSKNRIAELKSRKKKN